MKRSSALNALVCCLMLTFLRMFVAACVPRSALTPTPSNLPPSITPLPASVTPATLSTVTLLTRPPEPSLTPTLPPPTATLTETILSSTAKPSYQARLRGGSLHTCLVTEPGNVLFWGDNYFGQLGDGTDFGSWKPITPLGLSSVVTVIGSGGGHVCTLLENGGVRCWGDNSAGQVGDGTITGK